eukprot:s943_g14.t1
MDLSTGLVYGQLGLVCVMAVATASWHCYRERVLARVRRQCTKQTGGFGKALIFHSPDSVPRNFVQFGYRSNICGTICDYSWLVLPLAGYLVMIWGCYIAYVISDGIPFPPGGDYWKETFGSWNGLMLPWCVWFTIVHITAGVASKFYTAAWHHLSPGKYFGSWIVDEQVFVDPDDVVDPDETQGEDSWINKRLARLTQRVKRAKARQVMKIEEDADGTRHVEYTCVRYIYNEDPWIELEIAHAILARGGLSEELAAETLAACGDNSIHVHVPGILEALGSEFSDFTYIFNSIGTWAYIAYSTWNIGSVWLIMMLGSGIYRALFIVRPNQKKIAEMAAMKQSCTEIDVSQIVLGNDAKLPCDGILLQGSLIVNESMLTGEPMPIAKAPVENNANYRVTDKLNKAYAGTLALESTGPAEGKIPIAGKISTMVFDKTGTITKAGMDFAGVYGVNGQRFCEKVQFDDLDPESQQNRMTLIPPVLRRALATCHTVKQLGSTGALVGNQVECAMVRTVGMTSGAVVRDSSTQRLEVFIKGSYEKVKDWNQETSPD